MGGRQEGKLWSWANVGGKTALAFEFDKVRLVFEFILCSAVPAVSPGSCPQPHRYHRGCLLVIKAKLRKAGIQILGKWAVLSFGLVSYKRLLRWYADLLP